MCYMSVEDKAAEFGRYASAPTGWRLAWLVVSSATPGRPGRRNGSQEPISKVSLAQFSKLSSVSRATVQRYYTAWEYAAEDGMVPKPEDVDNADSWDELLVDYGLDEFEESEEPTEHWSYWYRMAKYGKSEPEPEAELILLPGGKSDSSKPQKRREATTEPTPAIDETQQEPSNDDRVVSRTSRKEILEIISRAAVSIRKMVEGLDLHDCDADESELAQQISDDLTESTCAFNKLRSNIEVQA